MCLIKLAKKGNITLVIFKGIKYNDDWKNGKIKTLSLI